VTDAKVIQDYYERSFGRETNYFPYGTDVAPAPDDGLLGELGLRPRGYVLYVSRLEPENNAHVVIAGYGAVRTELPLVIVGDAPYASAYIASLRQTTDPRIRFLGAIYGEGYRILQANCFAYVQATEVGGTHPALVEAMGAASAIVANDVPEHRETLGTAGAYYEGPDELASRLQQLIDHPHQAEDFRVAARQRAERAYGWAAIADAYELWFASLIT
jgi:glycosyltransferase involved in cell wall biosynthesis